MGGRFRKKPVVIDAWQFCDAPLQNVPGWIHASPNVRFIAGTVEIKTLEGTMVAIPGDWIIRGIKGELYPCKPDIFAATYEPEITSGAITP